MTQIEKGNGYHELLPTITINICDFALFETDRYHSTFRLHEGHTLECLAVKDDVLEVHFIEMTKFIQAWHDKELDSFDDILVRWLLLLGMVDARKQRVYDDIYKELEALAMKDERIREAFETWEELSRTPDELIAYESRLKTIIDEEARIADAKHVGEEKGLKKGLEKGKKDEKLQTARNLFKINADIETIVQATGFTKDYIRKLRKRSQNSSNI